MLKIRGVNKIGPELFSVNHHKHNFPISIRVTFRKYKLKLKVQLKVYCFDAQKRPSDHHRGKSGFLQVIKKFKIM